MEQSPTNIKGRVNIHPVTYKVNRIDIAANVYTTVGGIVAAAADDQCAKWLKEKGLDK
jgi:hypothetical protein